jgi:hypothetical protein
MAVACKIMFLQNFLIFNFLQKFSFLGDKSLILYDLIKMGDPIRIVENLTQKSIFSMSFDNDGDWGLGIGDWAQSPIPNPQSPIPSFSAPLFLALF